ncbi:CLUMA_CG003412, isoform A [Clunio marinus]|uniref:CLUMA_CG003412, isoform A n=1 Tax=Clunio marinus TaxID=568069 RepID=A0A1J1HP61_9DIPT|nr:CLUMA_CG003412, isoform A [Clunio marinus]
MSIKIFWFLRFRLKEECLRNQDSSFPLSKLKSKSDVDDYDLNKAKERLHSSTEMRKKAASTLLSVPH